MDETFAFPEVGKADLTYGEDDYYEGPVPRQSPGLPPVTAAKPSVYHLKRLEDNELMVELTVFDVANFAYDPPDGHVPQGDMQWYVRHPDDPKYGFKMYGYPFRYRLERDSYWDRNPPLRTPRPQSITFEE